MEKAMKVKYRKRTDIHTYVRAER